MQAPLKEGLKEGLCTHNEYNDTADIIKSGIPSIDNHCIPVSTLTGEQAGWGFSTIGHPASLA